MVNFISQAQKIQLNFKEDGSLGWKGHSLLAGATVGIAGLLAVCAVATVSILRQTPQAFQPIDKLGADSVKEAQLLYEKGITSKIPFSQIQQKIEGSILASGGTKFVVYNFSLPETCGTLGCLYVAVDQTTKDQIPLQLVALSPDKQMFKALPATNPGCFTVDQKSTIGRIESHEICRK
jgi:hypothetical protein